MPDPGEPTTQLDHLDEDDCWRRLHGQEVCRLAFTLDGRTELIPVNFAAVGRRLLFRTVAGSAVDRAVGVSAAFEADAWTDRDAWSVVVRGPLQRASDPGSTGIPQHLEPNPWPSRDPATTVLVELVPIEVRGIRFDRRTQPGMLWSW